MAGAIIEDTPIVPLAPVLVVFVLPRGLDARLKQVVVRARVETRRRADIVEDSPKVLHHVECRHLCSTPTYHKKSKKMIAARVAPRQMSCGPMPSAG